MSPAILILAGILLIWLVYTGKARAIVKAITGSTAAPAS